MLLGSRGSTPNLEFSENDAATDADMIHDAPVIIIGQAVVQEGVGPVRESRRLIRVVSTVENVIRGRVDHDRITFNSPWLAATTGDWNSREDKKRYIFFLRSDKGVLRAVRDYWRTNVQVYSGRHAAFPLTERESLTARLALLLFTPGQDVNPDEFSVGLLHANHHGWVFLDAGEPHNR